MYSLGKHAPVGLQHALTQADLSVDLMQEAVAGQRAAALPCSASVILAVEPCAQLLLVAVEQARLVAPAASRRADGADVGDLVGHEASSIVHLDGATDALDGAVAGPCCASAQDLGHVSMRQQSLCRKVLEGALSHAGLASAHDLHDAAACTAPHPREGEGERQDSSSSQCFQAKRLGLPAFLARHSPEADLERLREKCPCCKPAVRSHFSMFAIVLPYLLQPLTHGGIAAITCADALEEVLAVQVLEEVVLFGQCQERLEPVRQKIWCRDAALRLRDIHSCHSFCAPRCK